MGVEETGDSVVGLRPVNFEVPIFHAAAMIPFTTKSDGMMSRLFCGSMSRERRTPLPNARNMPVAPVRFTHQPWRVKNNRTCVSKAENT